MSDSFIVRGSIPSVLIGAVSILLGVATIGGDLHSQKVAVANVSRFQRIQQDRAQKEIAKLEADRAIADAAEENQVATYQEFQVTDYIKNPTPPRMDWSTSVNPNDCVVVRDKFRKLVGWAYGGHFYSSDEYSSLCDEVSRSQS